MRGHLVAMRCLGAVTAWCSWHNGGAGLLRDGDGKKTTAVGIAACPGFSAMEDTLFGYPLPFPAREIYVAAIAVACFIPAVVLINAIVHGILNLLSFGKKTKTQ